MFQEHVVFKPPQDRDVKIWRYMDFTKLVSMLESRQLFFTRADGFEDPYDCTWPAATIKRVRSEALAMDLAAYEISMNSEEFAAAQIAHFQNIRRFFAINCWHMNNHESAAMWKLYLKSDEGIAVQSTFAKLCRSITDDEPVKIGVVEYIDFDNDSIGSDNMLASIVHKRKSFEHEREVRAAVLRWPADGGMNSADTIKGGIKVKVDLDLLIEKVYVAPKAPPWLAELVASVINHYRYSFPVVHSELYAPKLY